MLLDRTDEDDGVILPSSTTRKHYFHKSTETIDNVAKVYMVTMVLFWKSQNHHKSCQ